MAAPTDLAYMTNLYMALADKTRLRLLNLMREQEVCVGYFTEILGNSQPKISRHLAYLRNADIVEARREGKWMHYRIKWPQDRELSRVIDSVLTSIASQSECRTDELKYQEMYGNIPSETSYQQQNSYTYANADISSSDSYQGEGTYSSHNDLEEFLL